LIYLFSNYPELIKDAKDDMNQIKLLIFKDKYRLITPHDKFGYDKEIDPTGRSLYISQGEEASSQDNFNEY
jgi:hypothetical protein